MGIKDMQIRILQVRENMGEIEVKFENWEKIIINLRI